MNVMIKYRGIGYTEIFPKNSYQLSDLADKFRGEFPLTVKIDNLFALDYVNNEFQIESYAELEKLNLFVRRVDEMDEEDEAKMFALMTKHPKADVSELLDMTYGLESVKAYSYEGDDGLTEFALCNEWLPVFEDCPYDILAYLDEGKVAEEVIRERNGTVYGGFYVETNGYKRPDRVIELPKPESGFFRLLLAPDRENRAPDRNNAEWLTLPCSRTDLEDMERRLGCTLSKMICTNAQTALPMIHPFILQKSDISELNELALKLSDLQRSDIVKLKAVMEFSGVSSVYKTSRLIDCLSEYEFDPLSVDASVFGKVYLFNNLPVGFDTEVFAEADMEEFGRSILSAKGGGMSSYGAVSGRGQSLFTSIAKEFDEEETEEIEDDESENESEELGACLT
jgi:hypothetical protein